MIRKIRNKVQGPAAKAVVFILCIPFALFGAEIFLGAAFQQDSVGQVNGESLSRYEYSRLLDSAVQRLQQIRPELDLEAEQLARNLALQSLIRDELLMQFASANGITYPQQELDSQLRSMPAFQEEGRYRASLFDGFARQLGVTRDDLRKSLGRSLLLDTLNISLLTPAPVRSAEQVFRLWLQRRDIEYLELPLKDFSPASLSEAQRRTYYQNNPQQFVTAEEVNVDIIHLSDDEILARAEAAVTPERIAAAYDAYVESVQQRIERRASHIMLTWGGFGGRSAQMEKAEELHARLMQGEDFATLAQEESQDFSASDGGDLGFSSGDVFPENFEQVLATLEVGQVSEPIVIEDAVHIIKLTQVRTPQASTRTEAEQDLTQQLKKEVADELRTQLREQLAELAYSSPSMEEIAAETSLEMQRHTHVVRDAAANASGPAADAALLKVAFSGELLSGELISEPIELQDGSTALVQVREHRPSRQQSFEEAGEQVRELLGNALAAGAQLQAVTSVEIALSEGKSLAEAAEETQLKSAARTLKDIPRTSPLLDPLAMRRAFALPVEAAPIWERVLLADGDLVLVRLLSASLPRLTDQEMQQLALFSYQLDDLYASTSFSRFSSILRQQADVDIKSTDEYEFGSGPGGENF